MNIFTFFAFAIFAISAQRNTFGQLGDMEKFFEYLEEEDPAFFKMLDYEYGPEEYGEDYPIDEEFKSQFTR